MHDHILDRPIWNSLNTLHAHFSLGTARARRFQSDVSPLAGLKDEESESLEALAELVPDGGSIVAVQATPLPCPPGIRATMALASQMMFDGLDVQQSEEHAIIRLDASDAEAMLALTNLTHPGPFATRTHVLGEYWGVKQDGQIIAMAGERLKQPGYTEISGVCTHPDFQGKGLARRLCNLLLARIVGRNEIPYLHVYATNERAIALYQALGFRERKTMHVAKLERA